MSAAVRVSAARDQLERYRADPAAFCRERLGWTPWSKQRELLEAIRDHRRVACRSGHGVGKTATLARVVLWWLAVWPDAIVVTTSATWSLVREQLWREIAVGVRDSDGLFADAALTDTRLELGPSHFAIGLSTDQAERFSGFHSEHLLCVLDEASGVPEDVWEAAETLVTSPGSRLVAVGNPTRVATSFHRAFTSERDLYRTLAIPATASPAVTGEEMPAGAVARLVGPDWIEGRRRAWGEQSPLYQVRVLGQFASTTDDTVFALDEVEQAQRRELDPGWPLHLSADVARFGSDQTVLGLRRGNVFRILKSYGGRDLMRTTGEIERLARDLADEHGRRPTIIIDDAGLGGGVVDRIREIGRFKVVPYLGARAASSRSDYPNARSQDWFGCSEVISLIDLPADDEELAADLVSPRYALDSQGRRVVEAKSETKKRLHRSPDRGDALVMAFAIDPPRAPGRARQRGYVKGAGLTRGRIDQVDPIQVGLERLYGLGGMRVPGSGA